MTAKSNERIMIHWSKLSVKLEAPTIGPATLGALHTMAEGQEAVAFQQSACKKPRVPPLDPSH